MRATVRDALQRPPPSAREAETAKLSAMLVQTTTPAPARAVREAPPATRDDALRERIVQWQARNGIPGVSVSVRRGGSEVRSTASGTQTRVTASRRT
jgi:hypothetical protein